ncbi:MAG: DUF1501 domain-containing protein, partial [Planctomycetota bacterium]|jgi:hypothetical protein|nr:DUF1501 domain-containing protein [Planctomycetota bacterium]MDP6504689.1 DUF1501 domain-containing protein [Planctomycetota bacterium]
MHAQSDIISVPSNDPILGDAPDLTGLCSVGRRGFLKGSVAAAMGSAITGMADLYAREKLPQLPDARADQCILLWMAGGPSQMETWDPKPGHANGGALKAIPTAVDGIQISETLPELAKEMDSISLVRSMLTKVTDHGGATYILHTGYAPSGTAKHPGIGARVSSETPAADNYDLPKFMAIRTPSHGAGFLGMEHEPLVISDPNNPIANLRYNVSKDHFLQRVQLLRQMEKNFGRTRGKKEVANHQKLYNRSIRLMHSKRVSSAFDLKMEPEKLLDDYGKMMIDGVETPNQFGMSLILARKLLETGVRFVEVALPGWDMHGQIANAMSTTGPQLDRGLSALMRDLRSRGMLERTLIVWMGEFGRTPRVNNNAGRDHWARSWSIAFMGGGINGGQVIGKTSKDGMDIAEEPKVAQDIIATLFMSMGIDYKKVTYSTRGRPIPLVRGGSAIEELVI